MLVSEIHNLDELMDKYVVLITTVGDTTKGTVGRVYDVLHLGHLDALFIEWECIGHPRDQLIRVDGLDQTKHLEFMGDYKDCPHLEISLKNIDPLTEL